jgi:formylglycine-generating enzyme required for sulfatase activity
MPKVNHKYPAPLYLLIIVLTGMLILPAGQSAEQTYRNSIGMAFILIPAGSFVMGSPGTEKGRDGGGREKQHDVTFTKPIYMQTTEVTVEQWESIMGKRLIGWRKLPKDYPITRVSWKDCQKFIKKLNARGEGVYRLPTEAEWEYACRAGSKTAYAWGDAIDCSMAMYGNKKRSGICIHYLESLKIKSGGPAPVKTFEPNNWGLYDMHGNVWEWCQDRYGTYDTNRLQDPIGPQKGRERVRRGGSWYSMDYDLRSANRAYAHPSNRTDNNGFRLVREAL